MDGLKDGEKAKFLKTDGPNIESIISGKEVILKI